MAKTLRTIPPGELTLGGYDITIPTYVMPPGEKPPVHYFITYRGLELWFACMGRQKEPAKGFHDALSKMPEGRRVVLAVTEGMLSSETILEDLLGPNPEPAPEPEPEPVEPEAKSEVKPEPFLEDFDAEEGQAVLVVDQKTDDAVAGTIIDVDGRSIEVEFGDETKTFTKRTNDTWVEKGQSASNGLQVVLAVG